MKREIKFRAWDEDCKVMETIDNLYWFEEEGVLDSDGVGQCSTYTIMQYTGLKDKDGVEIYEGDIIQYDNAIQAVVIFKRGSFCGYDGDATNSDEAYLMLAPEEWNEFELRVVGNIYENPELISK